MNRLSLLLAASTALCPLIGTAQTGPYKVLQTQKVGGEGGFDYVYADSASRKLYIPRSGPNGHITVYSLETFKQIGDIPGSGHGVAVDDRTDNGYLSSKPVVMFDSKHLTATKSITVEGNPDGIMQDPFNNRVYVFSHSAPNATVLDAKSGELVGTIDLGGAPEQAVSDEKGHIYVDLEDKGSIAVVDVKTLKVTATYDLQGKGGTCAGLAIDVKNSILFAACRKPQAMVILSAKDGKILETLPIGAGTDGAVFNPETKEVFSSEGGDGVLTIVKENSPTSFTVEQTLATMKRAKTLTLDKHNGHIILIAAEYGEAPPAAQPGGRAGRAPMIPDSFSILVVGK